MYQFPYKVLFDLRLLVGGEVFALTQHCESHLYVQGLAECALRCFQLTRCHKHQTGLVAVTTLVQVLPEGVLDRGQSFLLPFKAFEDANRLAEEPLLADEAETFVEVFWLGRLQQGLQRARKVLQIVQHAILHEVGVGLALQTVQVRHVLFGVLLGLRGYEGDQVEVEGGQGHVEQLVRVHEPGDVLERLFGADFDRVRVDVPLHGGGVQVRRHDFRLEVVSVLIPLHHLD